VIWWVSRREIVFLDCTIAVDVGTRKKVKGVRAGRGRAETLGEANSTDVPQAGNPIAHISRGKTSYMECGFGRSKPAHRANTQDPLTCSLGFKGRAVGFFFLFCPALNENGAPTSTGTGE